MYIATEGCDMRKAMALVLVTVFLAAVVAVFALATPASAASNCWKVDCNVCCRTAKGGVICTQRACV